MGRWARVYRRSSIQMILSLSFTAVAVIGMVFLGLTLFLRFSASNNAQAAKTSQRVLAQVNLNLDAYLRSMMRVSDAMYYRVIKKHRLGRRQPGRPDEPAVREQPGHAGVHCGFFAGGELVSAARWRR